MFIAIRDRIIDGIFPTLSEGCAHLGVEGVELELDDQFTVSALDGPGRVTLNSHPGIAAYRRRAEELGLRICAVLTARDLSVGEPSRNIEWLARAVQVADSLGAPVVRVDALMVNETDLSFADRVRLTAATLRAVVERTPASQVALGLENHGVYGNNLAFLLNVFADAAGPRVGLTLDTGNFYWRGLPLTEVYGVIRLLAPYVKHTHTKNIDFPGGEVENAREAGWEYAAHVCPLDEGDIDHKWVVGVLREHGYAGALCIECEALFKYEDAAKVGVLEREVAYLRKALAE